MPDRDDPVKPHDTTARRRGVMRTAWTMAGIAFAVYVLFILSGVLAQ